MPGLIQPRLKYFPGEIAGPNPMVIYGIGVSAHRNAVEWPFVIAACASAFIGAYVGAKLLKKVTLRSVQLIVSALLIVVGAGLIAGIL